MFQSLFLAFCCYRHSAAVDLLLLLAGVTGGLAAPLVAAGAGAVLGAGGAAALGSATGIAIMASLFGAAGAGLTGIFKKRLDDTKLTLFQIFLLWNCQLTVLVFNLSGYKMKKCVGAIEEFEFLPLSTGKHLHLTVAVTGWLCSGKYSKCMLDIPEQYPALMSSSVLCRKDAALIVVFIKNKKIYCFCCC